MDVRSKKSIPVAQSEDQEDELLSIVSIKRLVNFSGHIVNCSPHFLNLALQK